MVICSALPGDYAERAARVLDLVTESHAILDEAIEAEVILPGRALAAVALLYSGGNDSTVLSHMFRRRATHAIHCNTGIGIEQTRQFVRDTCDAWGLPLLEYQPDPGEGYEDLVLGECKTKDGTRTVWQGGFPGPASHWLMYQRLKERSLEKARRELVKNPRRERVVFLAGRRREESKRRQDIPISERRGSTVWVSPLVHWTKLDLNMYRMMYDVPRNEVSDLLHMSGECLCGAFAHSGELDEIGMWFPEVRAEIEVLQEKVAAKPNIPRERCRWGWGADKEKPSKVGDMCTSCDARFSPPQEFL